MFTTTMPGGKSLGLVSTTAAGPAQSVAPDRKRGGRLGLANQVGVQVERDVVVQLLHLAQPEILVEHSPGHCLVVAVVLADHFAVVVLLVGRRGHLADLSLLGHDQLLAGQHREDRVPCHGTMHEGNRGDSVLPELAQILRQLIAGPEVVGGDRMVLGVEVDDEEEPAPGSLLLPFEGAEAGDRFLRHFLDPFGLLAAKATDRDERAIVEGAARVRHVGSQQGDERAEHGGHEMKPVKRSRCGTLDTRNHVNTSTGQVFPLIIRGAWKGSQSPHHSGISRPVSR